MYALLGGVDISALRLCSNMHHVGYLPQDIELSAEPLRTSSGDWMASDPAKAIEAAKLVGLHETIMRLPQGYETDIGDGEACCFALSGSSSDWREPPTEILSLWCSTTQIPVWIMMASASCSTRSNE